MMPRIIKLEVAEAYKNQSPYLSLSDLAYTFLLYSVHNCTWQLNSPYKDGVLLSQNYPRQLSTISQMLSLDPQLVHFVPKTVPAMIHVRVHPHAPSRRAATESKLHSWL